MSTTGQEDDEIVTVTMSRRDERTLRSMLAGYTSAGFVGRWAKNVLLVAAAGALTLFAFGEQVKQSIQSLLGIK
tara:strand:+ start:134 stop:355 length:222 start_codon:yes stop_codon:yes gene_type:complete